MKIGTKIRRIREAKGIPMKELAEKLEMSIPGYSKIERNEVDITIDKLTKISTELGVTPEEIISFDDKNIFNNTTIHSCAFNHGAVYNQFPDKMHQLYEDKIKLLEDKIFYLNEEINRLKSE